MCTFYQFLIFCRTVIVKMSDDNNKAGFSISRFACDQCGKGFIQPEHLRAHIKGVHKQIRPYKCDYCHVSCSEKSGLKMHMRTHTGEKPFSCVVCGKSFSRKADCKKHQKTIHGKEAEPLEAESLAVEGNYVL